MKKLNTLFITLGSLMAFSMPVIAASCQNDKKDIDKKEPKIEPVVFKNKKELIAALISNKTDIYNHYENNIQNKYQVNQEISKQDVEFLKNLLIKDTELMKSDLLDPEDKESLTLLTSYYILRDYLTKQELEEMNKDESLPYYNAQRIDVDKWIKEIISGQKTSLTRFQYAIICEYMSFRNGLIVS